MVTFGQVTCGEESEIGVSTGGDVGAISTLNVALPWHLPAKAQSKKQYFEKALRQF
nr:hypothetical protein [uncultured Vibrio sp.]